ncbi:MAG: hypothetical protein H0W74_08130 [Sphingosinicella sp.]|nr:hypothetical protein [Sphingosinicella sp.]
MRVKRIFLTGGFLMVAACVPRSAPPPPPPPQRPALPLPPPPPAARDWRDFPLTPGNWYYRAEGSETLAMFGAANSEAQLILRCDRARRQVFLWREGVPTNPVMIVRTSFTARSLPATIQREPLPYAIASVAANDPILDSMIFSRGRFTIEAQGLPMLVVPSWPEPARVVEDCRG